MDSLLLSWNSGPRSCFLLDSCTTIRVSQMPHMSFRRGRTSAVATSRMAMCNIVLRQRSLLGSDASAFCREMSLPSCDQVESINAPSSAKRDRLRQGRAFCWPCNEQASSSIPHSSRCRTNSRARTLRSTPLLSHQYHRQ